MVQIKSPTVLSRSVDSKLIKSSEVKKILNSHAFRNYMLNKIMEGELEFSSCEKNLGFRKTEYLQEENPSEATLNVILMLCIDPLCYEKAVAKIMPIETMYLTGNSRYHPANVEMSLMKLFTENIIKKNISPHITAYYGGYKCSDATPMFFDNKVIRKAYENKEILSEVNVMITEYISGGTLAEFIERMNPSLELMKAIMFQIFYTLAVLQKKYKFMHNDFHLRNILMETNLPSGGNYAYSFNNKKYYVPNYGSIPKLWDFDFAAIYKKPKSFGKKIRNVKVVGFKDASGFKYTFKAHGIVNKFNPYYDVHLFLNSLWLMRNKLPYSIAVFVKMVIPEDYIGFTNEKLSMGRLKKTNENLPTPQKLLDHPFFDEFKNKPPKSEILSPEFKY